jgi:sorbitol-specific phosphotransferase system component IIC
MTIIDAVFFGFVGGLVTLKVFLLAAAAVLLVHVLTHRVRQRRVAAALTRTRHQRLDRYA